MIKQRTKRWYKATICIAVSILCCSIFLMPSLHAKSKKVIRVGWPIQQGLTMKDKNGRYSGYTYDYLKEIAQYTGWEYEFVEVSGTINEQLNTLLKKLEKGEIDLLGSMSYSEATAKMFDYPSENYGNAYSVLAVPDSENVLDEYSLPDAKNLKIALLKSAKMRNELFYQYAEMSGIHYKVVWCDTYEEELKVIETGKADAILSVDVALPKGYRTIAKFSPNQIYFATTKGNSEIIQELNRAMSNVNEINPMLISTLYNKYFNTGYDTLNLSLDEENYIEQKKELNVLVRDGFAPFRYIKNKKEVTGIASSVLDKIAKETGLKIHYVIANSYEEYVDIIKKDEIDMLLTTKYDYDMANELNIKLSNPFIDTNLVTVVHRGIDVNNLEGKKQAINKESEVSKQYKDIKNIQVYDSLEGVLDAIERGDCDYGYINSLTLSYNLAKYRYKNIVSYPQMNNTDVKYSFGITKQSNNLLTAILNKGMRTIKSNELEGFIYQNAQVTTDFSLLRYMEEHIGQTIIAIALIVGLIIALIYMYYHKQLKMKKLIEIENKRYHSLSDITNEIIFEYDYIKDSLRISNDVIENYITSILMSKDKDIKAQSLYQPLVEMKNVDMDIYMRLLDEETRWYRVVIKTIYDNGKAVYAIGKAQNIHEDKMERELLVKQSKIDGLTNLYNSATCKRKIQQVLDTSHSQHALCIVDVDYFKSINDEYGHYVGDQVLVHIANVLQEVFYESSIIGRLGGDEFIVLIKDVISKDQVEEKCRLIIKSLMHHKQVNGEDIPYATISIGIAMTNDIKEFTDIYKRADEALYHVKKTGRNNYYTIE